MLQTLLSNLKCLFGHHIFKVIIITVCPIGRKHCLHILTECTNCGYIDIEFALDNCKGADR